MWLWWIANIVLLVVVVPVVLLLANRVIRPAVEIQRYADDILEHGVLRFEGGRLHIDYAHYPAAVEAMLTEVLGIQRAGDPAAAEAFIDRWARWDEDVQGVLGTALSEAAPRYWIVNYEAFQ